MSNELIEAMARAMFDNFTDGVTPDDLAQAAWSAISDRVVVKGSAEPVAWLYKRKSTDLYATEQCAGPRRWPDWMKQGWTEIPLYAHPPKVDLAGVDELVGRLDIGDLAAIPEAASALQSLAAQLAEARRFKENSRG